MNKVEEVAEVFVGNVPWATTEDKLKTFFTKFGEVTAVKILKRVSHRHLMFSLMASH
jgi:RNA recognition motif-containing protein